MRYLIRRVFRKRNVQDHNAANPFTITIHQGPRLGSQGSSRNPHLRARLVSENPNSFVTRTFVISYNCEIHTLLEHGLRTQHPIHPAAETTAVSEYVHLSWERTQLEDSKPAYKDMRFLVVDSLPYDDIDVLLGDDYL